MNAISKHNQSVELATFYVGDALCGMDILNVQEINKLMDMTQVPQSPGYVTGILNLRGQIVTVIDLGIKLGLPSTDLSESTRNIIVNADNEYIGLLVSRISDTPSESLSYSYQSSIVFMRRVYASGIGDATFLHAPRDERLEVLVDRRVEGRCFVLT